MSISENTADNEKTDIEKTKEALSCGINLEAAIDRNPLLVSPETPLATVIQWMSQGQTALALTPSKITGNSSTEPKPVSYVLISQNTKLVGIFTEQDIVKLTAQGLTKAGQTIADVMTRQLITCHESELHDGLTILSLFRQHRIRHIPILDSQQQLIGVATPDGMRQAMQPTVLLKLRPIQEVMSKHVIQASPTASVMEIAQLMTTHQVSCIVLTIRDQHTPEAPSYLRPVGILTERDIVHFQILELDFHNTQAQAVMSTPLTCLSAMDSLWDAYQVMQQLQVRRLVIVDKLGALTGIITQTSFLLVLNPADLHKTVGILQQQITELQNEKVELLQTMNQTLSAQIKDNEAQLQATFDQAAVGIVNADLQGNFLRINQRFCDFLGYSRAEILTKTIFDVTHPDERQQAQFLIQQLIQGEKKSFFQEKRYCRADGEVVWASVTISQVQDLKNGRHYLVAIITDISTRKDAEAELVVYRQHLEDLVSERTFSLKSEVEERKRIERQLFQEKELAQVTLQSIGDGVITTDAAAKVTYLNPIAEQLTGWCHEEALGRFLPDIFTIVNEATRQPVQNPIERVLKKCCITSLAHNTTLISKTGIEYGIDDSAAPLKDRQGKMIGAVMVFRDVTCSRKISQQLSWQASHDALTGLVNRQQFEMVLENILQTSQPEKQHVIGYLDLDQFKIINDTCGHSAGDELLRQVSTLLSNQIRTTDTLARIGGDEFAILLHQCQLEQASIIANQIRTAVSELQFIWNDIPFHIGISIGLVAIDENSHNMVSMLNAADAACYTAKSKGRNRVQLYQADDADIIEQRGKQQWSLRIQQALNQDRFCLYQQVIVPTMPTAEKRTYHEILLRMVDGEGNLITPGAFIPAAERYDLMTEIDQWVVRAFFSYLSEKSASENLITLLESDLYMLNLSGASIGNEQFLIFLKAQLRHYNISPQMICFEITETAAIANLHKAVRFIQELKQSGFYFALDDFGSGMSSFSYLDTLPIDYLKIDGKFIQNLETNPTAMAIVESINHIGHVMGLKTIAECVETQQIQVKLSNIKIDFMQGYGIAMPCAL